MRGLHPTCKLQFTNPTHEIVDLEENIDVQCEEAAAILSPCELIVNKRDPVTVLPKENTFAT
jgi:hypothetical protein